MQQSQDPSCIKVNDVYANMLRGNNDTVAFVEAFNKFLRAYDLGMVEGSYERWVRAKIKRDGYHREHTDVEAALEHDRQLYDAIKKDGVKVPIRIFKKDGKQVRMDGCHRILISHHLGLREIPHEIIDE